TQHPRSGSNNAARHFSWQLTCYCPLSMATVRRLHEVPIEADGFGGSLSRLARLELGLTEARAVVIRLGIAIAVAVASATAFVAALVVLVAAAFAPLFGAAWPHLVIAGGGVVLLSLTLIAWAVMRVRNLKWPHGTIQSIEETWRWLAAQLKSRLT